MKDWLKRSPSLHSQKSDSNLSEGSNPGSDKSSSDGKENRGKILFRGSVRKRIEEIERIANEKGKLKNKLKEIDRNLYLSKQNNNASALPPQKYSSPVEGESRFPTENRGFADVEIIHVSECAERVPSESCEVQHSTGLDEKLGEEIKPFVNNENLEKDDVGNANGVGNDQTDDVDEESVYVSRKLLMRQLMEEELKTSIDITEEVEEGEKDDISMTDSWAEMEESFTRIYEPVPFNIKISSLRKMTKKQILSKVSSKRLVEELKPLSRIEVLRRIESLYHFTHMYSQRETLNDVALEDCELDVSKVRDKGKNSGKSTHKERKVKKVAINPKIDFSNDALNGNCFEDLTEESLYDQKKNEDSLSWNSLPRNEDGVREPVYISRSDILANQSLFNSFDPNDVNSEFVPIEASSSASASDAKVVHLPFPPISRKVIINNMEDLCNQSADLTRRTNLFNGKRTSYFSRAEVLSQYLEMEARNQMQKDELGYQVGNETSPCSNTEYFKGDDTFKKDKNAFLTHSSRSSWSLDDLGKDYSSVLKLADLFSKGSEEEIREILECEEFIDRKDSKHLKRSESKDSWSFSEGDELNEPQKPLSRAEILNKKMRLRESPALELQHKVAEILSVNDQIEAYTKRKVMHILSNHIKENISVESQAAVEEKNREVRDRLQKALAKDWETLRNINLGLIYVPMEESSKTASKLLLKEGTDYDTFGSLDSLIFEPRSISSDTQNRSIVGSIENCSSLDFKDLSSGSVIDTSQLSKGKDKRSSGNSSPSLRNFFPSSASDQISQQCTENEQVYYSSGSNGSESFKSINKFQAEEETDQNESAKCSFFRHPDSHSRQFNNNKKTAHQDFARPEENASLTDTSISSKIIPSSCEKFNINNNNTIKENRESVFGNCNGFNVINSNINASQKSLFENDEGGLSNKILKGRLSLVGLYDYHPDNSEPISSTNTNASSSIESESANSGSGSITSIESVIFNSKCMLKDTEEEKQRKGREKKYVVNRCGESDTSSEQGKGSDGVGQNLLLDSDSSWDYIEPYKAVRLSESECEAHQRPSQEFSNELDLHANKKNPFGKGSFFTCPKNCASEEASVYEACERNPRNNPVTLIKHHVYQSIESLRSSYKGSADGSSEAELQMYGSRNGEPIYGAKNSRLFRFMNGACVGQRADEDFSNDPPYVVRNGIIYPLTEDIFKGKEVNNDNSKSESETIGNSESFESGDTLYQKETPDVSLDSTEKSESIVDNCILGTSSLQDLEKMKKVQKFGISLMGNQNNERVIQELKLKLRSKFIEDIEEEMSSSKQCDTNDHVIGNFNSVASKRELLAPHMSKIINSVYMKNQNLTCQPIQDESVKDQTDNCNSLKDFKPLTDLNNISPNQLFDGTLGYLSEKDGSLVWVPTPDYTPLSTLNRDQEEEVDSFIPLMFSADENSNYDFTNMEKLLKLHLKMNRSGKSTSGCPESALMTDERRANKANSSSVKRSVRFDTKKQLSDLGMGATWSDLESVIFAEDRSFGSETFEQGGRSSSILTEANAAAMQRLPESRMESYKDDWLLWDQLAKMRKSKSPEDKERWELEKTKRMLLWIHLSNNNAQREWCYKSHWWKAKQKASVSWIVQKAHKNKVPADLEDPYYKDYEGLERLKPGLVHRLSNADLYCSALANIYGDPNFHNLSHWNIIQALARKGVYVAEPTDVALTETVLIQTTPIKMSAHLAVIEAMMALYIKEVVIAERVVQSIQRISGASQAQQISPPQDQEEALVLWVEHTTQALQARIHEQVQTSQDEELPVFPKIQDLSDLSDGIGLAALVAFYCPQELSWGDIAIADPPSMADSLYNISLVIKFCLESLPYNPCLLTKEDIVYMHSSVKQNILAFVAELFFLMELEPVSCVTIANARRMSTKYIQLSSPGSKPAAGVPSVRRSHSMNLNDVTDTTRAKTESRSENAPSSHNSDYGGRESSMSDGQEGEFLVQRAKGFSTLSDMMRNQTQTSPRPSQTESSQDFFLGSSRNAPKERYNIESKEEEMGERRMSRKGSFYGSSQELNELPPAGIPSRLEQRPAGRSRSRRNSINAEESQLTIENFGGSQDNLNYISRNPDKEPYTHFGRRDSQPTSYGGRERPERRSSSQTRDKSGSDFRGSVDELDNRMIDKLEKDALEKEKRRSREALPQERRKGKLDYVAPDSSSESEVSFDPDKPISKATSFAELSRLKEQLPGGINIIYMQSDRDDSGKSHPKEKKTTFATLPNQTTWKQQSAQHHGGDECNEITDDNMEPQIVSSELHNVKLKLEEKRRRIETEKRKMEAMMNKQRQKLGKEAFMQAVVKGDLGTEVSNLSKRWLDSGAQMDELRTPDMDAMDYDEYQKSLSQMTDSLTEIQSDIQRLNHQQQQIQSLMQNGVQSQAPPPPHNAHPQQFNQFYLHDQQGSPVRRMWNHPGGDGYASLSPATRRAQWGPVRPMVPQNEFVMAPPPPSANYYSYQMNQQQQQHQQQMQLPQLTQMGQPPLPPPSTQGQGNAFMLHGQPQSLPAGHQPNIYQNGQNYYSPEQYRGYLSQVYANSSRTPPSQGANPPPPFRLHNDGVSRGGSEDDRSNSSLRSSAQSSPSRQGQGYKPQKSPSPSRQVSHAPVSAPPPDDMEPQNVCFIDSDEADKLKRLSISSGSRTYRITHEPGSPTRPSIGVKTFRVPTKKGSPVYDDADLPQPSPPQRSYSPPYGSPASPQEMEDEAEFVRVEPLAEGPKADKGFYISLDDNAEPKRPKPPLRMRRLSQKKTSAPSTPQTTPSREDAPPIPDRSSLRNSSGILDSPSYGSLKLRRDSSSRSMTRNSVNSPTYSSPNPPQYNTSRSDVTLSPSSSASSIPPGRNSNYWSPHSSRHTVNNNNNKYDEMPHESDTGSDNAYDDTKRVISKRKSGDHTVGMALVIGEEVDNPDSSLSEMEKKKEKLMLMSIRRKQQQEEMKRKKEIEAEIKREEEKEKEDSKQRKKEEERARRELILERHKIKKAIEEAEKEGRHYNPPAWYYDDSGSNTPTSKPSSVRLRNRTPGGGKPRPKTMHEASSFTGSEERLASRGKKGSYQNVAAGGDGRSSSVRKSSGRWGSSGSLTRSAGNRGSTGSIGGEYSPSSARTLDRHSGRRPTSVIGSGNSSMLRREQSKGSMYGSRDADLEYRDPYQVHESRRPSVASPRAPYRYRYRAPQSYSSDSPNTRKYRSTGNLYGHGDHESLMYHMSEDSGIGRATPPRRAPSPGMSAMSSRHLPSPSGPGSLPPGLFSRRRPGAFDDNMSDISTTSSNMDYCGPRLFKQPTSKSNRNIILNAVEYCVFPGVVNQTAKHRVLEEVARSESKHFLILFRDAGCQFRALYSYNPDMEEVYKLYGTGPKQVTDRMFDKFFKYNSGGKCFSQIHTKHLTVTIDAFTIHNSLWQGKKVNLPSKKDMKLVI